MALTSTLGHAPKYTFTVGTGGGARTPFVWGYDFGSKANGGHDKLSGFISNDERLAGGSNYTAWTPLEVKIATGETGAGTVVWDGYVARNVQGSQDNKCRLFGVGAAEIARKTFKNYMFRTDDLSLWGNRNSDDANFPGNYRHISSEVDGRLAIRAEGGAYGVNNVGGLAWVGEDVATKFSFVNAKGVSRNNFSWLIRTFTPPLFDSDTSYSVEVSRVSLSTSGPAAGSTVTKTLLGSQQRKGITFELVCTTAVTLQDTSAFEVFGKVPRVYGIASSDSYYASSVVTHVGADLGYNTSLVQSTTTPILPVYWKRSASVADLLDQMCDADQMFWLVRNRSSGVFQIVFSTWSNAASVPWYADVTDPAVWSYDIDANDDLVNGVQVFYETLTGRPKVYTAYADGSSGRPSDPFAGKVTSITGKPVFMDYNIDDPQPDATYPTAVANALIKEYAVQQYEGTVELASARITSVSGTEKFAVNIMAGDRLVLVKGNQPGTYRITEAKHFESGVTRLTIGRRPGDFLALQAKHLKKIERKGLR